MSSAIRVLGAAVVVSLLAAGNLARETCWTQADGVLCGPLARTSVEARVPPAAVSGLTRIEVPAPEWRPLSVTVGATRGGPIRVSADAGSQATTAGGGIATVVITQPPAPNGLLTLWAEPAAEGSAGDVRIVAMSPVLALAPVARALVIGGVFGALLAGAVWFWPSAIGATSKPPAVPESTRAPAGADRLSALAAPIAVLAIVHGAWIVLKPPLQSPDEPQHHARATSAPRTAYVAGSRTVMLAAAHRNPLTWTPNRLHAIILNPTERLTDGDVRALRATPWQPAAPYPEVEAIPSPIASYPPLYYALVFAGGELATQALALSPYASVLAYRTASVLLAGAVWLAIYLAMRRTPALRTWALPAFVLLAANPVTASITSSVNPDALVIPASVWLLLATWRRLASDGGLLPIVASALLAVAVKPSGMLAIVVAGVGAAWWLSRDAARRGAGLAVLRALILVAIAAYVCFYAWSPPRLVIETSHAADSPVAFASSIVTRAPAWWVEFWGRLGWVEYSAAPAWYWLAFALCGALLIVRLRAGARRDGSRATAADVDAFLVVTGVAYIVLLLGSEYSHLRTAPLFIQGRYLLPASLGLVPLVRQRSLALTWSLPALVVALDVALAQATIARYFAGGWASWFASLG